MIVGLFGRVRGIVMGDAREPGVLTVELESVGNLALWDRKSMDIPFFGPDWPKPNAKVTIAVEIED